MSDFIRAARERNTLAPIHRKLSNENICDIFLALAYLDTPSLASPEGWFLQVNGVCHLWRELAVNCPELWARSAGSFPSRRMTDLAILRAKTVSLSFDGHYEDIEGPGYVLTDYQMSLIETHVARLRSLVHDDYTAWSELFYCLRAFPELKAARIWDDSGPDMWDERIDTPRLQHLYLNNALIPFNAPALRCLRVDMDNIHWRTGRDVFNLHEPVIEGCEAVPRVFPTREFIAFLQCSPLLERLIITDMPLLLAKYLPSVYELRAKLPNLRGLHLGGKSDAMGDMWRRLEIPPDAQVFIDTDWYGVDTQHTKYMHRELQEKVKDQLSLPVYDSLKLGMTPSYDIMLQMWSSEAHNARGLELSTSLEFSEPALGAAFTVRLPVGMPELLQTFPGLNNQEIPKFILLRWRHKNIDPFHKFRNDVAEEFYNSSDRLLRFLSFPTLQHIDLTDMPFVEYQFFAERPIIGFQNTPLFGYGREESTLQSLFHPMEGSVSPWRSLALNWKLINHLFELRLPLGSMDRMDIYFPESVRELTIVDFPCASFPDRRRYDDDYNSKAWDILLEIFERYSSPGSNRMFALKLAESTSEISNMERSEEPEYEHAIQGSYEDAVKAVTEKGHQRIAPFVTSFEDLRVHTWS